MGGPHGNAVRGPRGDVFGGGHFPLASPLKTPPGGDGTSLRGYPRDRRSRESSPAAPRRPRPSPRASRPLPSLARLSSPPSLVASRLLHRPAPRPLAPSRHPAPPALVASRIEAPHRASQLRLVAGHREGPSPKVPRSPSSASSPRIHPSNLALNSTTPVHLRQMIDFIGCVDSLLGAGLAPNLSATERVTGAEIPGVLP